MSLGRIASGLLALSAFAAGAPPAAAPDLASRLTAETARLREATRDESKAGQNWKDEKAAFEIVLGRIDVDLAAGRFYRSLELIGQARDMAADFEKPNPASGSLAAFESEWKQARVRLSADDESTRQRVGTGAPAAIRAISEASGGKSLVLLDASRAFAAATNAEAGFYYLGKAAASSDFAKFCFGLERSNPDPPPPLRSVATDLARLQARTNAAFQPPRSIDLHPVFIRLNATLKTAAELDSAGLAAGALYQYLDAVQQFGLLDAASPDASAQTNLRRSLEDQKARFTGSGRDDSIGQLFVERAEELAALPDTPPSSAENWRRIRVIVEQVLPAYLAALAPAPPASGESPGVVTVTLVRWPYT